MSRNSPDDDAIAVAVREFGFFTTMGKGYIRWDRHTGIILLVDAPEHCCASSIRLIDQRGASSESTH